MAKKPKLVPKIDPIDLEAEREGLAIRSSSEARVKKTSKKSKTKTVDSRTLDEAFFEHYGYGGFTSRKED